MLRHVLRTGLALAAALAAPAVARAQDFDSGSTGSDGALTIAANQPNYVFDPTTFDPPLDPDGDNVFHFTTIDIGPGTTVRLSTRTLPEGKPVVWLASGDVRIQGVLDLNGETGHNGGATAAPAIAGAGGYSGGTAIRASGPATPGNGPGGGQVGTGTITNGGSAGHATVGGANQFTPPGGAAYGNEFLLPLIGGSGGAGGKTLNLSPGGGGGGGALLVASSTSILLTGQILANGGAQGTRSSAHLNPAFAGGGSGGAVRLIAPVLDGGGAIRVAGGSGAVPASYGRVRLEAFRHRTTFTVTPGGALMPLAAPGAVMLPPTAPAVRIVRVAGQAVALSPSGSFVTPDVTIDAPAAVTVEVEARHVPLGTVLTLTFQPETGAPFTATSTPLAGTVEQSTATVQAQFPHGPTRVFMKATWTPAP